MSFLFGGLLLLRFSGQEFRGKHEQKLALEMHKSCQIHLLTNRSIVFRVQKTNVFSTPRPISNNRCRCCLPTKMCKEKREVLYISPQIRLSSFLFSFPPLFAAAQNSIAFACGPPLGSNATRIELAGKKTFLREKRRRGEARFMSRGKGEISLLEESGFFPFSLFNYFCG